MRGWDDPRLPTLAGMRRRGITPRGINMLCHEMGITRSDNEIPLHKARILPYDVSSNAGRLLQLRAAKY